MARQDLDAVFRQFLGRAPSQQELDFFGKFIDEGHLQPYEVGQYLQASPEATQSRLPAQTQEYSQVLAGQDEAIMSRAGDQLASQFYQQGRPRSSGYTAAYLNAARDLAISRQPQVADFYRQGAQGVSQGFQRFGEGGVERGYGLRDQMRQRQWGIDDYYRQQNDFNSYLRGQESRNLRGSLINAGIGLGTRGIGAGMGAMGSGGWAGASEGFGLGGSRWR